MTAQAKPQMVKYEKIMLCMIQHTKCLLLGLSAIGYLVFESNLSVNAQMSTICSGKNDYIRLSKWKGGLTGRGGYYETEFCGRLLSRKIVQSEVVVELNGKDGSGAGIYSMNCSNGRGYWKSNPNFMGISGAELEARTDSALKKAFSDYC